MSPDEMPRSQGLAAEPEPIDAEAGRPSAAGDRTGAPRSGRDERIVQRERHENWKKPPRRIEKSECITCDLCLRNCPPEFGAIFDRGLDVVIVPELCSGCPACVLVCPVDCIYVDEDWPATPAPVWDHIALTSQEAQP